MRVHFEPKPFMLESSTCGPCCQGVAENAIGEVWRHSADSGNFQFDDWLASRVGAGRLSAHVACVEMIVQSA